jgi:hypothetical protein
MACFQTRFIIARRVPRRGAPAGLLRRGATPLLQMNTRCLSLRRSLGDCGNPREQSISWIATSLRFSRSQSGKWFIALITERLGVRSSSRNDRFENTP